MKAIFTAFSWQFYNIITYSHSHAGMVCRGVVLHQREYSIKAACVFFFFLVHLARSVRSLRCCFDGLNCGISDFLAMFWIYYVCEVNHFWSVYICVCVFSLRSDWPALIKQPIRELYALSFRTLNVN